MEGFELVWRRGVLGFSKWPVLRSIVWWQGIPEPRKKKTLLLSVESWLVNRDPGILIMVYYNPYITGQYFIPEKKIPTNQGPFFLWLAWFIFSPWLSRHQWLGRDDMDPLPGSRQNVANFFPKKWWFLLDDDNPGTLPKNGENSFPPTCKKLDGGNSKIVWIFTPKIGEMIQFDLHIFFKWVNLLLFFLETSRQLELLPTTSRNKNPDLTWPGLLHILPFLRKKSCTTWDV